MRSRSVGCLAMGLLCSLSAFAGAADPVTSADEQLLRAAKWPVDPAGLLQNFRDRTLSVAATEQAQRLVVQLGDDDFVTREKASAALIRLGPAARLVLRQASTHPDAEISRRARACLEAVEQTVDPSLTAAALRLLKASAPEGAAAVVLAYLPFADDEFVEEEGLSALLTLGVHPDGVEPVLRAAVTDEVPARRAASALVVSAAGDAAGRQAVRKLLDDPEPRVRWRAAQGLVAAHEPAAVPTLLALLSDGPLSEAREAEAILARMAGEKRPAVELGEVPAARHKAAEAWKAWWEATHGQFDWSTADVAVLPGNPARPAQEVVQVLIDALKKGDASAAMRTFAIPFLLENEQILKREELEALIRLAADEFKNGKHHFAIKRVVRSADFLQASDAKFKDTLTARVRGPWLAVIVDHGENGQKPEPMALVVRVSGSRAQILAVGPAKAAPGI